jgi:hypothetical protein
VTQTVSILSDSATAIEYMRQATGPNEFTLTIK